MATRFVKASYQEVYDLGTVSSKVTILGIHSPSSTDPTRLLSGFYRQFRKVRYTGCSVTMIPAAQLPADPLQVSYEAGESAIDPRDLLNPILFHGCHGDSLNDVLDSIYANTGSSGGVSADSVNRVDFGVDENLGQGLTADDIYYSSLADPSFRKFNVQSGLKVSLRPMVHPVVATHPILPGGGLGYAVINTNAGDSQGPGAVVTVVTPGVGRGSVTAGDWNPGDPEVLSPLYSSAGVHAASAIENFVVSNGLRPLGWMPTTQMGGPSPNLPSVQNPSTLASAETLPKAGFTYIPRVFMGLVILPPSYKQELYFRMVLTHYFEFKDFSSSLGIMTEPSIVRDSDPPYTNGLPDSVVETTSITAVNANIERTTYGVF